MINAFSNTDSYVVMKFKYCVGNVDTAQISTPREFQGEAPVTQKHRPPVSLADRKRQQKQAMK